MIATAIPIEEIIIDQITIAGITIKMDGTDIITVGEITSTADIINTNIMTTTVDISFTENKKYGFQVIGITSEAIAAEVKKSGSMDTGNGAK